MFQLAEAVPFQTQHRGRPISPTVIDLKRGIIKTRSAIGPTVFELKRPRWPSIRMSLPIGSKNHENVFVTTFNYPPVIFQRNPSPNILGNESACDFSTAPPPLPF